MACPHGVSVRSDATRRPIPPAPLLLPSCCLILPTTDIPPAIESPALGDSNPAILRAPYAYSTDE